MNLNTFKSGIGIAFGIGKTRSLLNELAVECEKLEESPFSLKHKQLEINQLLEDAIQKLRDTNEKETSAESANEFTVNFGKRELPKKKTEVPTPSDQASLQEELVIIREENLLLKKEMTNLGKKNEELKQKIEEYNLEREAETKSSMTSINSMIEIRDIIASGKNKKVAEPKILAASSQAIERYLESNGVEIISDIEMIANSERHSIVSTIHTDTKGNHNVIHSKVRDGYATGGHIIRPQEVVTYKYS